MDRRSRARALRSRHPQLVVRVDVLAEQTGVSARQLRRRFDGAVGYGPAFFARVARLQRFAAAAGTHPHRNIANLAAAAGYADQSHLAKDCRTLADVTPTELKAALPRTSVAGVLRDVRSVQDIPVSGRAPWAA